MQLKNTNVWVQTQSTSFHKWIHLEAINHKGKNNAECKKLNAINHIIMHRKIDLSTFKMEKPMLIYIIKYNTYDYLHTL